MIFVANCAYCLMLMKERAFIFKWLIQYFSWANRHGIFRDQFFPFRCLEIRVNYLVNSFLDTPEFKEVDRNLDPSEQNIVHI